MARRLNIDGDDQADRQGHGGEHRAVFVYQIESYDYWQKHLRRDDFVLGQFGENFTVEGLADVIAGRVEPASWSQTITAPRRPAPKVRAA